MIKSKAIQIVFIVACLGTSAFMLYRYFKTPDYAEFEGAHIHFYLCSNTECELEYSVMPDDDLGQRDAFNCPDCASPAADAARCPSCGRLHRLVGHGRYLANCPHCDEKMPGLVEQLRDGTRDAKRNRSSRR